MTMHKNQHINIYGNGEHSAVVTATLLRTGINDVYIMGDYDIIDEGSTYIVAIGDNGTRMEKIKRVWENDGEMTNVIDPSAIVIGNVDLDAGIYIGAMVVVNMGARVRRGAILNTSCIVEHDTIIKAYAHICPGAIVGGACVIGEGVLVGPGAVIGRGVVIGDWAVIGAGSVVLSDVKADARIYGLWK